MQTLTEIVAAVVVHSSAVAYSHFGVTLEAQPVKEPTSAERTVARSIIPRRDIKTPGKVIVKGAKATIASQAGDCPDQPTTAAKA